MSTLVMGVVNVTPDSFSDGGEWFEPAAAIAHGLRLIEPGRRPARRGRGVDPARRRAADRAGGAAPGPPGGGRAARGWARGSRSTPCAPRWPPRRCEAGAAWSTTSAAAWPTPGWPRLVADSGVPYVAMHWRGHSARHAVPGVVRRRGPGRVPRADPAGGGPVRPRRPPRADRARPRVRVRQAGRAQLAAAGPPRPGAGAGLPGARRHLPQVVPRPARACRTVPRPVRRPTATSRPRRPRSSPRWPGRGACGCTTCLPPSTRSASWPRWRPRR